MRNLGDGASRFAGTPRVLPTKKRFVMVSSTIRENLKNIDLHREWSMGLFREMCIPTLLSYVSSRPRRADRADGKSALPLHNSFSRRARQMLTRPCSRTYYPAR